MTTTASAYNVRTAAGTVHRMTTGRTFRQYGATRTNRGPSSPCGKADCGALTSAAAAVTDQAVNCPKCGAR
jgi:hypothetical protein